jgi:hypothetical protein
MPCVPRPVFRSLRSLAEDRRKVLLVFHPNRGIARIRPSNTIRQTQYVRWEQAGERAGEQAGPGAAPELAGDRCGAQPLLLVSHPSPE